MKSNNLTNKHHWLRVERDLVENMPGTTDELAGRTLNYPGATKKLLWNLHRLELVDCDENGVWTLRR